MAFREGTPERRAALYLDVVAAVREHYARPGLTIETVARMTAASPRQVQRVLAECGGTTFTTLVMRVRMRHAAEMLARTDLPVAAIATSVGYREPSNFSKVFRTCAGRAPREFRRSATAA